jgi:hypothetical protein
MFIFFMSDLKYFSIRVEGNDRLRCFASRSLEEFLNGLGDEDPEDGTNSLAYMRGYILDTISEIDVMHAKNADMYANFARGDMSVDGKSPFDFEETNHPVYLGILE